MRISRSATYAVGVLAAAGLLAACSGAGTQPTGSVPSGVAPMSHAPLVTSPMSLSLRDAHSGLPAFTAVKAPVHVHSDRHKSWVSAAAKDAPRILFEADDSTNDVYVYLLPSFKLKGTLTGFSEPQGMCEDAGGNIWITNTATSQIFQYSRTGTLMKTLSDAGEYPVGCAVNKSNGDVAVTNLITTGDSAGDIMVYPNGTGSGTPLSNPSQFSYYFPTYDESGNLYADGGSTYGGYILSECPSGSSSCSTVNISGGTVHFPGGLNWDRVNNELVAGDQECGASYFGSCQYAMTVSGSSATITGSTQLTDYNGGACDVDQGTLAPYSRYFAGGCISESSASSVSARWSYPTGTMTNDSTVSYPIGSAISNK